MIGTPAANEPIALQQDEQDLVQNSNSTNSTNANATSQASNSTFNATRKVVHLFPHSHTDEGWVSTVDDFYTGNDKDGIYVGGVKDIFDTTITEMILNPNRTFAFAEMKNFKRWYDDQETALKDKVKELVLNGQLDLVGGGWSSPDEATTTYD